MAVQGDRAALERLLLDHYAVLVAHLTKRLPPTLRAVTGVDDIIQQAYTQVFTGITSYKQRSGISFQSWLVTIAENRLRDAIRAQKRKKRGGDFARMRGMDLDEESHAAHLLDAIAGTSHTPSQSMARREAIQAIQVAVAGLPPEYREAIRLRYFDGYTLEEVAALMQRTTGAVRGLLDRAKKKMRDSLERASRYLSSR
jgi:RNA polymerase sigma-70 factor (ECF subfamily)